MTAENNNNEVSIASRGQANFICLKYIHNTLKSALIAGKSLLNFSWQNLG